VEAVRQRSQHSGRPLKLFWHRGGVPSEAASEHTVPQEEEEATIEQIAAEDTAELPYDGEDDEDEGDGDRSWKR